MTTTPTPTPTPLRAQTRLRLRVTDPQSRSDVHHCSRYEIDADGYLRIYSIHHVDRPMAIYAPDQWRSLMDLDLARGEDR